MWCAVLLALILIVVLLACEVREVALRVHESPRSAIVRRLLLLLLGSALLLIDVSAMLIRVEGIVARNHGPCSGAGIV